jgi:beta-glucosidase
MPEGFVLFEKSHAKERRTETASAGPSGDGVGGDRASLCLRPIDEQIITAVAAANSRTVLAIVAAGAVITETWRTQVPATLIMWYAGMEGGHALTDVLTGSQNPSGRLPFSIPTSDEHLPFFDRDATSITYDRFHGQRLLDRLGVEAAYPHGFGLSYTTFSIVDAVVIDRGEHGPQVRVAVHNNGDVDGRHVVQIYGRRSTGNYANELLLAGFAVAAVPADTTVEITVDISMLALAEWDPTTRQRVQPNLSDVTLEVSSFAHDPSAILVEMVAS